VHAGQRLIAKLIFRSRAALSASALITSCAVAADRPLPGFLVPEQWLREGPLGPSDAAPLGFREQAAVTGMRLSGYYLFQELRTGHELGQSLNTTRIRAA
jgi:hypothetical protein